jgi:hypothetical protein
LPLCRCRRAVAARMFGMPTKSHKTAVFRSKRVVCFCGS